MDQNVYQRTTTMDQNVYQPTTTMDKNVYQRIFTLDKNVYQRNKNCYLRWERDEILAPYELKWARAHLKKLDRRKDEYWLKRRSLLPPKDPKPPKELVWGDTYDPDGILSTEEDFRFFFHCSRESRDPTCIRLIISSS